jgi:hypothetical protein
MVATCVALMSPVLVHPAEQMQGTPSQLCVPRFVQLRPQLHLASHPSRSCLWIRPELSHERQSRRPLRCFPLGPPSRCTVAADPNWAERALVRYYGRLTTLLSRKTKAMRDGIQFSEAITGDGAAIFRHACWMNLEGIVSKRSGSRYVSDGRVRGSRRRTRIFSGGDARIREWAANPDRGLSAQG